VSVVNEHEGGSIVKRRLQEGKGWETPRPPFEVPMIAHCLAELTHEQHWTLPADVLSMLDFRSGDRKH